MNQDLTKNLMHMTYGIYVLTTRFEDTINGMIASWVSQVSYAPPLILAAVHPNRYSHELLQKSGCFVLHSIARDQKELLLRFKGPDPDEKFSSLEWSTGVTGSSGIEPRRRSQGIPLIGAREVNPMADGSRGPPSGYPLLRGAAIIVGWTSGSASGAPGSIT